MAGNGVNVGHGNISISPVLVPGFAGILQAQLSHLRPQPQIQVGVQVDQRGLQGLNRQINGSSGAANRLQTAFAAAFAALSARKLLDTTNQFSNLSRKMTAVTAAATSAGSVLGPLLGLVGGLGAGLAVAGAGIGAFAALAAPQLSAVKDATTKASDAQDAYNTAIATGDTAGAQKALKDRTAALATLTPAQRAATEATLQLKSAFKAQSDALAPVTLGLYTNGVKTLTSLLPALTPVARAAGSALQGVFSRAQAGLGQALSPDGGLGAFLNTVKTQIGPTIDKLASIFVNLGNTISFVFQRAVPVMQPALAVIQHLTGALANAAGGQGLIDFFAKVKPLLIPLQAAIQSIVGALGAFIQAALPLAGPVLGALRAVGDALKGLFNSAPFQAFVSNIGSAVTSLTPIFAALVGPIGQILQVISGQFAALAPTLVPLISQFAQVFSQVLVGLSPLLPIFVQLAGILVGFLPILYPVIQALRDALAPILVVLGQTLIAIMPAINQVVQAFVPLAPLLGQLLAAVIPVIGALISGFAPVLAAILTALQPIIPVITQFVAQLGGALVQALNILLPALLPLIPPLGQLLQAFLQLFIAALQPLLPVLPVMAQLLASLVPVLIPLINAFTWLVNFIRPIAPLLLGLVSPFFLIVGAITLLVQFWTWAWNTVIFPILRVVAAQFAWVFQTIVVPAFHAVMAALGAMGAAFSWVWNTIIHPVLDAFWNVAKTVGLIVLAVLISPLILGWTLLSWAFRSLWDSVLHPVFNAVAATAGWLWNNVLRPTFAGIQFGWALLVGAMRWAWDNILHPVWNAISAAANWLYRNVLAPIFHGIGAAWSGLVGGIQWVWDHILHPVFSAVARVVGDVRGAFDAAIRGIKSIWDKLGGIFKAPVKIVIDVVDKFDAGVNWILDKVGLKGQELPRIGKGLPRFAKGGLAQPGWALVGEEGPELVNFANPGRVYTAPQTQNMVNNPGGETGGARSWIKDRGKNVKSGLSAITPDIVGSVIHSAGDAAQWVYEQGTGLLRQGAADAVSATYGSLIKPVLGLLPNNIAGNIPHATADSVVAQVVEWIRGKEASDVGDFSGGPGESFPLIIEFARSHGSPPFLINSTKRNGGGKSFHDRGMAIDFGAPGNNPAQLTAIARFWDRYSGSLLEQIYSGDGGHFVKNGQHVGAGFYSSVIAEHFNHVHIAATIDAMNRLLGRSSGPAGEGSIVAQVHQAAQARGWGGQLGALDYIISHESSWNPNAQNSGSTAHGLFQLLYGSGNSVGEQITNGFNYIAGRYGNPDNAQRFWASHHWYDNGGYLMPGATMAFNHTSKPEPVFTSDQWKILASGLGSSVGGGGGPLIGTAYIREEADADLVASRLEFKQRQL